MFLYQYDFLQFLLATAFFFIAVVSYVLYDEMEGPVHKPWKWFCLFALSVFFCRLAGVFISPFIDPAFALVPRLFILMVSNLFLSLFVSENEPKDSGKKHIVLLAVMFFGAIILLLVGELFYAYMLSYLLVFVPIAALAGRTLLAKSGEASSAGSKYVRNAGYLMMLLGIFLPFPLSSSFAGVFLLIFGGVVSGSLCFCLWMYLEEISSGPVCGNKDADNMVNASMFIVVILILIFGFVMVNLVGSYAYTLSSNEARLHLSELKDALQYKVDKSDSMVKALSGSPYIIPALVDPTAGNLKNANSVLDRYRRSMDVSICYLMDDKGTVLASSNRDESLSFVGQNYSFREYFSSAKQGNAGRQFALGVTTGIKGYFSAYPVFGRQNKVEGVVAVKVDIEEDRFGGDQMVFILSNGGKELFVASPGIYDMFSKKFISENIWKDPVRDFIYSGRRYLMLSEKIGNMDASLGLIASQSLITYMRMFAIAITFLLVFVAGLGNHFIRKQRYGNLILRHNQQELVKRTKDLEGFFGVNLDLLCIADLEGNFVKVNKEWENVLGYSVEELEKRKFLEFVHPDDMEATLAEMAKLSNNEQVLDFINRYRCKDGSYRYIEWRSHPNDKLVYAAARDITQRKKMEQSLRDSEQWLDKSLMSIGDGVVSCDAQGNIAFMNPVAEKITGWTKQDAVNRPIGQVMVLVSENTGDPVENPVSKVIKEGNTVELANHTILISKDGRRVPIDDSAAPIRDKDGNILGVILVFRDVTAKRESDRKVRQLSRAVESSSASIVITDTDGNILYVNPKFCELTGYCAEEAIGQNPRVLKSGSQTAEFYKELWDTILAGNTWHGEFHNKKKDGSLYWEYASISPIKGEDGKTINYVAVKEDITERKKTEYALKENRTFLESIVENIPDMIFVKDAKDLRFTLFNKAGEVLLGNSRADLYGKNDYDFFPKEQAEFFVGKDMEVLNGKKELDIPEEKIMTKNIGERILHTKKIPVLDEKGEPVYLLGISEDITERKNSERLLAENAGLIKTVISNLQGVVFSVDKNGIFTLSEGKTLSLLGLEPGQVVGQSVFDVYKGMPEVIEGMKIALSGKVWVGLSFVQDIVFDTYVAPIFDEAGDVQGATGIATDITERERSREAALNMLEDLTETKKELEKYSKELEEAIEVKAYFVSMVSHELRTPLTAVKEGIGIVHDGSAGKLNREQKQFLEIAKRNVDRLHRLIDDVLDFSKLEAKKISFQMKKGDLGKAIREAAASQEHVAKAKGLYLKVDMPGDMPQVEFDPDRITQVMTNLLSNAIKFTQNGGIDIYAIVDREENTVKVCIKDTGVGIKDADIGNLFQKFYQIGGTNERRTGGTGLGLAISKEVIEQHRGRIWVESIEGEGSKFFFTLPVVP